ncbi:LysM peptidoglycan-binding domain-containing protein [[Clostridium] colinum]|uniref:LysM peptidoglycan-binding domain-containing protein n=1 Tax=[Clostridium] colinum TaxID=36835 RepID=UPI002025769B|nr:LysM domain-containing protein [[Clostridium] colinum]
MNKEDNTISLPKNIKQMGNIDDSLKIYMEDYVFTYLQQYSKCSKGEERIAILVGDTYTIDNNDVLFINGAIKGKHTINEDGMVKLSKQSFEYIEEQINKYFTNSKIVGWFYSQPGFSDYINEGYINYHKETFKEKNQVFFLSDPLENIGGFYKFFDNNFESINGFIIYYEKNEAMSEYMLNNKPNNTKLYEEKFKAKDEKLISLSRERNRSKELSTIKEYKKMSNIFGSLSAVLFLICFIMGAGLIQSDDKISELEKRLAKLDESYRYILSQIKDDNVQSVFAQNNANYKEQITEQTTQQTEQTTYMPNTTTISHTTQQTTLSTTETTRVSTTNIITDTTTETTTKPVINRENLKKYEVKEGDSLELISKKFYGNRGKIEEIMDINQIDNPDKIYVGMILLLP